MDHPLAGAPLCRLAEISDGEGRGFILGTGAEQVALFVVRDGDHAFAYVNACPHQGTPLDWGGFRSEEHTSELQSLMRISYAVFCLKKKKNISTPNTDNRSPCNTRPNTEHRNKENPRPTTK